MKTFIVTPAFCKAKLLEHCLAHIYSSPIKRPYQHVVLHQHYPVDKERNGERIKEIAQKYGCHLIDSGGDLGLHEGLNNMMRIVHLQEGDHLVGCDPDDRPSPGWVDLLTEGLEQNPNVAVMAAVFWVIIQRRKEGVFSIQHTKERKEVWIHPSAEMFNIVAFNTRIVNQTLPFEQPNKYYGGIESALYGRWTQKGMRLAYLPDVSSEHVSVDRTDPTLFDPEYRAWKTAHVGGDQRSFGEWLNAK